MDAVAALHRIAFLLERAREPRYRAQAFRKAARTVAALPPEELREAAASGRLQQLPGIGEVTARVVAEALAGEVPAYLKRLEAEPPPTLEPGSGAEIYEALRGDCHTHSEWSDGGNPIREMAETARDLGHEYIVLTDHSPRLKIANGLSPERLRAQLEVVTELNRELAPFRILAGIEVDILEDGALDQEDELLARLDIVVASAHSLLRMEPEGMTRRLVTAVANPHLDILGHCTGRLVTKRRPRPESTFDSEVVFAACARFNKAVEINARPERQDPPSRLMSEALELGCLFALDSDAHTPGQLAWQPFGCERAAANGVPPDRIVNTLGAEELLAWARSHDAA